MRRPGPKTGTSSKKNLLHRQQMLSSVRGDRHGKYGQIPIYIVPQPIKDQNKYQHKTTEAHRCQRDERMAYDKPRRCVYMEKRGGNKIQFLHACFILLIKLVSHESVTQIIHPDDPYPSPFHDLLMRGYGR